MNNRAIAILSVLFIFILFLIVQPIEAAVLPAAPLSDRVPGDAVIYLGWAGADSQAEAYQHSDLRALLEQSNLLDVARQYVPKWIAQLEQQGVDRDEWAAWQKTVPLLWKHPSAIYVSGVTSGPDGTPGGRFTMICDAGTDVAELQTDLTQGVKQELDMKVSVQGSLVALTAESSAADSPDSKLADDAAFIAAMQKLQPSPAIAIYIDGKTLLTRLNESAAKDTHGAADIWPKVRDALGIGNIKTFAMTDGFDGKNWMSSALLAAPGPRTGLLAAIEPQPIDPALLARIPASADSVSVCNVDLAKIVDTIGDAMTVRPESDKLFHQASGALTVVLGANFRRQIIGPLGPQWIMYSDVHSPGVVMLNHPTKASTASDAMESAIFGLVNEINSQMPGAAAKPVVTAAQSRVNHVDITSAVFDQGSPSVGVNNGVLYFGLTPEAVTAGAASPAAAPGNDLLASAGFRDAMKRVGAGDLAAFTYCNLPETAPRASEGFAQIAEQLKSLLKQMGVELPKVELPSVEQLKAHLTPAVSVSWADSEGMYCKSMSPFPMSEQIFGDPQQTMVNTDTVAIVGSILMPALQKARSRAMAVQAASQERQVLIALIMYSSAHQGQYPPDLGSLVTDGKLTGPQMKIFLAPSSAQKLTADVLQESRVQQAAWVNQNSDYTFLTPNRAASDPNASTTAVLVPKNSDNTAKLVPVGFADGHVESVTPSRLQDLLHPPGPDGSRDGL